MIAIHGDSQLCALCCVCYKQMAYSKYNKKFCPPMLIIHYWEINRRA